MKKTPIQYSYDSTRSDPDDLEQQLRHVISRTGGDPWKKVVIVTIAVGLVGVILSLVVLLELRHKIASDNRTAQLSRQQTQIEAQKAKEAALANEQASATRDMVQQQTAEQSLLAIINNDRRINNCNEITTLVDLAKPIVCKTKTIPPVVVTLPGSKIPIPVLVTPSPQVVTTTVTVPLQCVLNLLGLGVCKSS